MQSQDMRTGTRAVVCKVGDVEPGAVKRVDLPGLPPLAVFNVAGSYFVTDDICTHGKASLSEGYVDGDTVECPWHGGRFRIATGKPTCLPAVEPIQTYPVVVVGDEVCIAREGT
jgi:nitrite reductase/ring-hydroxylating ferredoxin subunit